MALEVRQNRRSIPYIIIKSSRDPNKNITSNKPQYPQLPSGKVVGWGPLFIRRVWLIPQEDPCPHPANPIDPAVSKSAEFSYLGSYVFLRGDVGGTRAHETTDNRAAVTKHDSDRLLAASDVVGDEEEKKVSVLVTSARGSAWLASYCLYSPATCRSWGRKDSIANMPLLASHIQSWTEKT